MAGLDPAIHAPSVHAGSEEAWITGSSPVTTT